MYEKKVKELDVSIDNLKEKVSLSQTKIQKAREVDRIKSVEKELKGQKEEADKVEKEWKAFDYLIKKGLPILQQRILAPIKEKVPGLEIKEGIFTYKGIPLDTLSGSEVVQLSLKLMALQENANILLINEAECMDEESFANTNFEDFSSVIVARVAKEPLGEKWKSVEMTKKKEV